MTNQRRYAVQKGSDTRLHPAEYAYNCWETVASVDTMSEAIQFMAMYDQDGMVAMRVYDRDYNIPVGVNLTPAVLFDDKFPAKPEMKPNWQKYGF